MVIINRDNPVESERRFLTHMKRLGACEDNSKPGDMMLMHWRENGEETLKARQRSNVHQEIADYKKYTASQLAR